VHGTQGATGALLVTRPGPREAWRPAHLAALRIFADTVSSLLQRVHADELYRHSEQARHRSLAATVAGLAHELNTPLGVALTAESVFAGELERLASDHPGISLGRLQRASQLMRSNVERAAQHVRTFRSVVLEQTHDGLTDIDLRGFVEHVVASLAPLLRRHRLAATLAPTPAVEVVASCIPGRIAQVVTNLIENAGLHAYGPDGGPLAFEVTSHGRFARIRVADRGAGMSSAIASRCMEPFYTSRRHEGGTGLGLFIVRQVIQDEHRGCVELQTAPGQGTDWVLEFPLRSHPGDAKG
jgi:signal transduction histidine kinase